MVWAQAVGVAFTQVAGVCISSVVSGSIGIELVAVFVAAADRALGEATASVSRIAATAARVDTGRVTWLIADRSSEC